MSKLRVAVDFDGVLHSYTSKWIAPEVIPDPPVPGAIEWLNSIWPVFAVFIFTTRAQTFAGQDAVAQYLRDNGFTGKGTIHVTSIKGKCHLYIDDRGYRFTGANFPSAEEIQALDRWGKPSVVAQ